MPPKETEPQAKRLSAFERFTAALLRVPKSEADALDAERKKKLREKEKVASDERL